MIIALGPHAHKMASQPQYGALYVRFTACNCGDDAYGSINYEKPLFDVPAQCLECSGSGALSAQRSLNFTKPQWKFSMNMEKHNHPQEVDVTIASW